MAAARSTLVSVQSDELADAVRDRGARALVVQAAARLSDPAHEPDGQGAAGRLPGAFSGAARLRGLQRRAGRMDRRPAHGHDSVAALAGPGLAWQRPGTAAPYP